MDRPQRVITDQVEVDVPREGSINFCADASMLPAARATTQISTTTTEAQAAHNDVTHVRVPAFGRSTLQREARPDMPNATGASLEKDEVWWVALWVKALVIAVALSIAAIALEQAFGWVSKLLHVLAVAARYAFKYLHS